MKLTELLCVLAKHEIPGFEFTSIQVNKNYASALHTDGRDAGASQIIGFGNYIGGKLWIANGENSGHAIDIKNRWFQFDGTTPHAVFPFEGDRYSLVYFMKTNGISICTDHANPITKQLHNMGFELPKRYYITTNSQLLLFPAENTETEENCLQIARPQWNKALRMNKQNPHGHRVLHMYSGKANRRNGLAYYLREKGFEVDEIDLVNGHDVINQSVWETILEKLKQGVYSFVFGGPPCRTFSDSRSVRPGPPVLRDWSHVYRFPEEEAAKHGLNNNDFQKIETDNRLAERMAQTCEVMMELDKGFAVEQPFSWRGNPSMFEFESFKALSRHGATSIQFDQCMYGGVTTKPTIILSRGADFAVLRARCNHGRGAHPKVVSRKDENGIFKTQALAAYPEELNKRLAEIMIKGMVDQQNGEDDLEHETIWNCGRQEMDESRLDIDINNPELVGTQASGPILEHEIQFGIQHQEFLEQEMQNGRLPEVVGTRTYRPILEHEIQNEPPFSNKHQAFLEQEMQHSMFSENEGSISGCESEMCDLTNLGDTTTDDEREENESVSSGDSEYEQCFHDIAKSNEKSLN